MAKPEVSIIIPCYNESATILSLLNAICTQAYPQEAMEAIIVDGMSTDDTRLVIKRFMEKTPEINLKIVDNPQRKIPTALNLGVEAANGKYIIRLDAHSIPKQDYVQHCIEILERTDAANVGGLWKIEPGSESWIARGIAAAASHPLGAGGARYRTGGPPGPVETVPFGAFKRTWIERVGKFNESLLTNEDYEYNLRLRKAGGEVFFDPRIRSVYIARSTFRQLIRQYARYGFWKASMLRRFPSSILLRQLLPPLLVLSILVLGCMAFVADFARLLLAVELGVYLAAILTAGFMEAIRKREIALAVSVPIALACMHFSWGSGFLWSFLRKLTGSKHGE